MTIALLIVLGLTVAAHMILVDRKDKRHDKHVHELLQWRHDPARATTMWTSTPELLYLPPEDDMAWNERHKAGD